MKRFNDKQLLHAVRETVSLEELQRNLPGIEKSRVDEFFTEIEVLLGETSNDVEIFIDGSSDSSGKGGVGVVILVKGKEKDTISKSIGKATNNQAEYDALIAGVKYAEENGLDDIKIYSDSQLLVNQINGRFRVKSDNIIPLFREASEALSKLSKWSVRYIPREENSRADILAKNGCNLALH